MVSSTPALENWSLTEAGWGIPDCKLTCSVPTELEVTPEFVPTAIDVGVNTVTFGCTPELVSNWAELDETKGTAEAAGLEEEEISAEWTVEITVAVVSVSFDARLAAASSACSRAS